MRNRVENRYTNIDLCRTICAVFVVFEHFCEQSSHNAFGFAYERSFVAFLALKIIYTVARTAVPVFFIISGYLSVYSLNQKLGKILGLFAMVFSYSYISLIGNVIISGMLGTGVNIPLKT